MRLDAGYAGLRHFQDLMRYRIMDILLVATPYDAFMLEEAGELQERVLGEFRNLDVHYAPGLTAVESGEQALELAAEQRRFNLILAAPHLVDMDAAELAKRARAAGLDAPVVVLAWDASELGAFSARLSESPVERAFLWQGDARLLLAIVKSVEDARNAPRDSGEAGVQVILLVEDSVRHYSSFLPAVYAELLRHSQRVIAEGLNLSQKILRMRARPKIILCTTYEEAEAAFAAYHQDVLGIISDVEFPRGGEKSATAGAELARAVRGSHPDIPIILHSSFAQNEALAKSLGARFLLKGSPFLLQDLSEVLLEDFGFGDFVFRRPDGEAVGAAGDLRELEAQLAVAPETSITYHAARNHFSRWLKARTEFALAHELRPRRPEDYPSVEALRQDLIRAIGQYRETRSMAVVEDFESERFALQGAGFYRIGGGSLGGKARGLAFVRRVLAGSDLRQRHRGVAISVPTTAVLGTDVFDRFLDDNDLRHFALACEDDEEIEQRFLAAALPEDAERDLQTFLSQAREPLAVRSSSLLEDSQHQPLTGVYETFMLRNAAWSLAERVRAARRAVQRVYASTFNRRAKAYLRATPYRLEEEKMAVLLQRVVGARHGSRFYPEISGVARSYNFYPSGPMTPADGIAALALGLGRTVVDGGRCLRFSPRYPQHVPQLGTMRELLQSTQRDFLALDLDGDETADLREVTFPLSAAESDGTLAAVASSYSRENDVVTDGISRPGQRVVTFAPVLKHEIFPLAAILRDALALGERSMGGPVEIEFAVNLSPPPGRQREFAMLQMRPLAVQAESEALESGPVEPGEILCRTRHVLGNGRRDGLRDVVAVDYRRFDRGKSREAAAEIGRLNGELLAAGTPYLLIGVGRWGSRDPWLGIPVTWDQVSGARVIVEAGLRDLKVAPSQGSHFFQNLTSFDVGYFTIDPDAGDTAVDWDWLQAQPALSEAASVRRLRLSEPLRVMMNGKTGEGVILKPDPALRSG
jgi:CheY-like chemotaxis protein